MNQNDSGADPTRGKAAPEAGPTDAVAPQSTTVREVLPEHEVPAEQPTVGEKVRTLLVGKPLDLADQRVFQHISLVAFLAWVGLGADGLSSSCYGPAEAFEHLKEHSYLAIFLAVATMFTVFVISACYSHIIAAFPGGGGGYLVASKVLGPKIGALAGCALLVDYVLMVTVSVAAAGDATFGLLGLAGVGWDQVKLWSETAAIIVLAVMNLRGVKESITILMPIFMIFLITHAIMIFGAIGIHLGDFGNLATDVQTHMARDINTPGLGWFVVISMFLKAYSMGAGTYTGIESVSNSMAVMREPRVATGQRTMIYMAVSLAVTAAGLMIAYLLYELELRAAGQELMDLKHESGRTLNDLLAGWFSESILPQPLSSIFRWITVLSEAALLIVAAQAGFIGAPKTLAIMAHDSWVPHWLGSLSERLSSHYGIMALGLSSVAALWGTYLTRDQTSAASLVSVLILMYSINVFLTFSLSTIGMAVLWYKQRDRSPLWRRRVALFSFGAALCLGILAASIYYKFFEGGWKTVLLTGIVTALAILIRRYYRTVAQRLKGLDETLGTIEVSGPPNMSRPDPEQHTAAILVGGYSGLGVHTLLNSIRFVPNHFKNIVFISVGVVDSGNFKGAEELESLRDFTEGSLNKYVDLARRLGFPAVGYMSIGTDVVDELEQLCRVVHRDFPRAVVFAGQLVFQRETWYGALLHNQTAYSLQRRLQWDGVPMVILPTRVRD